MATQHELVELSRVTKQRIFKFAWTVFFLEHKTERVLWVLLRQTAMTAMEAHAAIGSEVMLLRTAEEFGTGMACPSVSRIVAYWRTSIDIYSACLAVLLVTKEVVLI